MSKVQSGNATHDGAVTASEGARQNIVQAAGVSQATAKAADIAHYRTCLASALANGCGQTQFSTALRELGTGGV